jgi:hypothetical protein
MASFKFVAANGKTVCRGSKKNCIGIKDRYGRPREIPKGSKSLEISVYGAGGGVSAYYCEVCLVSVLNSMKKCLQEADSKV